jgi:hypothetical protein
LIKINLNSDLAQENTVTSSAHNRLKRDVLWKQLCKQIKQNTLMITRNGSILVRAKNASTSTQLSTFAFSETKVKICEKGLNYLLHSTNTSSTNSFSHQKLVPEKHAIAKTWWRTATDEFQQSLDYCSEDRGLQEGWKY